VLTLVGTALLLAMSTIAAADYARLSRTCYWLPHEFDVQTLGLFHLDEANAGTATGDVDAMFDDLDTEADDALTGPGSHTKNSRSVANAGSVGAAGVLLGKAKSIPNGRFSGGVQLNGGCLSVSNLGQSKGFLSAELWLKLDALPDEARTLMDLGSTRRKPECQLLISTNGQLQLQWFDKRIDWPNASIKAGEWTHISLGLSSGWPTGNAVYLFINGHQAARVETTSTQVVSAIREVNAAWFGGSRRGVNGLQGLIDEVRISRTFRQYHTYEIDRWQPTQQKAQTLAPPFVRAKQDLIFHLPFNGTTRPAISAPGTNHKPITLSEADIDFNPGKVERTFPWGVQGRGAGLGGGGLRPQYEATGNILPQQGTVAFWMRPVDWDNFTRDNRFDTVRPTSIGLFQLDARTVPGSHEAVYRKVGPLLQFTINQHLSDSAENPPKLHPGTWTHVAVTWEGVNRTYYVNGRRRNPQGAFEAAIEIRTASDPYPYKKRNARWWLECKPVTLRFTENRYHDKAYWKEHGGTKPRTVLDDFRIYRRPLAPSEISNLFALYAPDQELKDLPAADMQMHWNGVSGTIRAHVTPLGRDFEEVQSATVRVTRKGSTEPVGEATMSFDSDKRGEITVRTPPLSFNEYSVTTRLLDAAGKARGSVSESFERTPPPWWRNRLGISEKVMPPWTPVAGKDNILSVWGRDIHYASSGLPEQIVSRGRDVLGGPIHIDATVNGQPVVFTRAESPEVRVVSDVRGEVRGQLRATGFTVQIESYLEFDGMMWFTVTLAPDAGATPVIDRLVLTMPRTESSARYIHWWSGPRNFRDPKHVHIGELPGDAGTVFRSNDAERVNLVKTQRGSFIPYLMLTGDERGMAWFSENDRGWTPNSDVPAVSVERTDKAVSLVLNIVSKPITLKKPRQFSFGLHPTPVRPLDPQWRQYPHYTNVFPDTFTGNNLKGRKGPSTFYLYPEDSWDAVKRRIDGEGLTKGAAGLKGLYEKQLKQLAEQGITNPLAQSLTVPGLYWDMQWNGIPPSLKHTREWTETWAVNYQSYTPEFVDFCSWAWNDWIVKTNKFVRGAYIDDCWGAPQTLPTGPTTYRLPDGHVQPGFQFLGPRERFKRMRQISLDHNLLPRITAHTTHTFFVPYHSFFDLILDGEDYYSSPPAQTDFLDHWPLERLRFMHNAKWGQVTTWLGWHGNSLQIDRWPAWTFRQQRAYEAGMAMHDIMWPFDSDVIKTFGLKSAETVFIPYWEDAGLSEHDHKHLKISAWKRPGRCLVLLVNVGDKRLDASVRLSPEVMGFDSADGTALRIKQRDSTLLTYFKEDNTTTGRPNLKPQNNDADVFSLEEKPEDVPLDERKANDPDGKFKWHNNTLTCPVRRHDYRLFEFRADF